MKDRGIGFQPVSAHGVAWDSVPGVATVASGVTCCTSSLHRNHARDGSPRLRAHACGEYLRKVSRNPCHTKHLRITISRIRDHPLFYLQNRSQGLTLNYFRVTSR